MTMICRVVNFTKPVCLKVDNSSFKFIVDGLCAQTRG
jgi:hypothetical protein